MDRLKHFQIVPQLFCCLSTMGGVAHAESSPLLTGLKCTKGVSVQQVSNGDDLAIVFQRAFFELIAVNNAFTASQFKCQFEVDFDVPHGHYVSELRYSIGFGYEKSAGASIAMASQSSFEAMPIKGEWWSYYVGDSERGSGEVIQDWNQQFETGKDWPWIRSWCNFRQRNEKRSFTVELIGEIHTFDRRAHARLNVDGMDFSYGAGIGSLPCPNE